MSIEECVSHLYFNPLSVGRPDMTFYLTGLAPADGLIFSRVRHLHRVLRL